MRTIYIYLAKLRMKPGGSAQRRVCKEVTREDRRTNHPDQQQQQAAASSSSRRPKENGATCGGQR